MQANDSKKIDNKAARSDGDDVNEDSNQKDDSDEIDLSTIEIDPDEPTYCLCDQVCNNL